MDICVRNGNYDDALDLRAFVAKLALIHPHLQVLLLVLLWQAMHVLMYGLPGRLTEELFM